MAQCYRNSGSLKNGMAAQAHRTSGSFAPRLFTLFTTLAINHTNTALATENSSTVSEESTTEDESEASTNHEIQPVSDKSPRPMD